MQIFAVSATPIEGIATLCVTHIHYYPCPTFSKIPDFFIVTSKHSFEALRSSRYPWHEFSFITVGEKLAALLSQAGAKVVYASPHANGASLSYEIGQKFDKSKSFIYLRGEEVAYDVGHYLRQEGYEVEEYRLYETICSDNKIDLPSEAIFLFGAPSSVKCFYHLYGWQNGWKAIALGATTAKACPSVMDIQIAPQPSFQSAYELACQRQNSAK